MLGYGLAKAWRLMGRLKPAAVVGFGGYPTIPPVLAASLRKIPTVIHDANAVIGRANRLLAPRVDAIAMGFRGVVDGDAELAAKTTHTGNPVRPAVVEAAATFGRVLRLGPRRDDSDQEFEALRRESLLTAGDLYQQSAHVDRSE